MGDFAMTPKTLSDRIEKFTVAVMMVSGPLLKHLDSRDSALQLRRAVTGASSNYGAACVARSHADFTSKIGVALEEADETLRWLRLMKATELLNHKLTDNLVKEAVELKAILLASHLTAKANEGRYSPNPRK
jgi:four helix bundle protein